MLRPVLERIDKVRSFFDEDDAAIDVFVFERYVVALFGLRYFLESFLYFNSITFIEAGLLLLPTYAYHYDGQLFDKDSGLNRTGTDAVTALACFVLAIDAFSFVFTDPVNTVGKLSIMVYAPFYCQKILAMIEKEGGV